MREAVWKDFEVAIEEAIASGIAGPLHDTDAVLSDIFFEIRDENTGRRSLHSNWPPVRAESRF
jgi:hypothetical protein